MEKNYIRSTEWYDWLQRELTGKIASAQRKALSATEAAEIYRAQGAYKGITQLKELIDQSILED